MFETLELYKIIIEGSIKFLEIACTDIKIFKENLYPKLLPCIKALTEFYLFVELNKHQGSQDKWQWYALADLSILNITTDDLTTEAKEILSNSEWHYIAYLEKIFNSLIMQLTQLNDNELAQTKSEFIIEILLNIQKIENLVFGLQEILEANHAMLEYYFVQKSEYFGLTNTNMSNDPHIQAIYQFKLSGKILWEKILSIKYKIEELQYLFEHFHNFQGFLQDFVIDAVPADINIISIGCSGQIEQQIYPWVLKVAESFPTIQIKIYLIDKFVNSYGCDQTGIPNFAKQASSVWIRISEPQPIPNATIMDVTEQAVNSTSLGPKFKFIHGKYLNITVYVYEMYFPTIDSTTLVVNEIYPLLLQACSKILAANKMLIASTHTGGSRINSCIVKLFNHVNKEQMINCQNFIMFAQNNIAIERHIQVYVYCNTIYDVFEFLYIHKFRELNQELINNPNDDTIMQNIIKQLFSFIYEEIVLAATDANLLTLLAVIAPKINDLFKKYLVAGIPKEIMLDQMQLYGVPIIKYLKESKFEPSFKSKDLQDLFFCMCHLIGNDQAHAMTAQICNAWQQPAPNVGMLLRFTEGTQVENASSSSSSNSINLLSDKETQVIDIEIASAAIAPKVVSSIQYLKLQPE